VSSDVKVLNELYNKLSERITEARETLKDLHNARRELEETARSSVNMITSATEKALKEVMPEYMKDLKGAVGKACDIATDKVFKRFDGLAAILMGEDDDGQETLTELVREWRAKHE
jgi:hypothetical protein